MQIRIHIRSLDEGNKHSRPKAKIVNLHTHREVTLQMSDLADFHSLRPHHGQAEVTIFACPIVEALGFDIYGGDLMFLAVA